MTATTAYTYEEVESASGKWWLLLITGILWLIVSVVVLRGNFDSAVTIGYLIGGFLIAAGVMEFIAIGFVEGWKWVHATIGVLFVLGGIAAFTTPFQTFMILSSLFGLFLVLKGGFDFVISLVTRHEADLWWLLLITGILEIALGFWAAAYPGRSAWLLLVWVGLGALIRGISQLVMAFQVRKIHKAVV